MDPKTVVSKQKCIYYIHGHFSILSIHLYLDTKPGHLSNTVGGDLNYSVIKRLWCSLNIQTP